MKAPYHNQSVVDRIAKENEISTEEAERWFEGALQFLEVASVAGSPVSPSLKIDEAWHAFILHTRDYAAYCQERFGRFIHHQPTGEGVDNRDNYLLARSLAEERFGDLDSEVWPVKAKKVSACSDPDGECSGQCAPNNSKEECVTDCGPERTPALVGAAGCHDDGHCGSESCASST